MVCDTVQNFLTNLIVKEFCKSIYICWSYDQKSRVLFLWLTLYIGWLWRNFFIFIYASFSGRRDVGQGNVNIL